MFDSVDEMVEEDDRRRLDEDLPDGDQSAQYVFLLVSASFANGKQPGASLSRISASHPPHTKS